MNPSTTTGTVIRVYGAAQAKGLVDALADLWADAHPELPAAAEPDTELSVHAFRRQVTGHSRRAGFTLAGAYSGGTLVGFGYAFPCSAEYWFGEALLPRIPAAAREGRLMGLCELAVRPGWQSQGIGTQVHAHLVRAIAPEWSSLLVAPDNPRGHALYERLGYRHAGEYRNTPDGQAYDLLLARISR